MYFYKHLKNTVKDEIENNNGNVVIYACDGNKKTKVQKKAWSQYEDCKNFSTFTILANPHTFTVWGSRQ